MNYRITPACAGKSSTFLRAHPCRRDHPRVCGEKVSSALCSTSVSGSPPRVRGKACWAKYDPESEGITPACAGKRLKKALKNKDF